MDQKVYGGKKITYTQLLPFQLKIMAEAVMNISRDGTTGGLEHWCQTGPSIILLSTLWSVSLGFPSGSDSKESACIAGVLSSISGLGRSQGKGNGNPLQYSCLENPMNRGYSPWGHRIGHDWATNTLTFFFWGDTDSLSPALQAGVLRDFQRSRFQLTSPDCSLPRAWQSCTHRCMEATCGPHFILFYT